MRQGMPTETLDGDRHHGCSDIGTCMQHPLRCNEQRKAGYDMWPRLAPVPPCAPCLHSARKSNTPERATRQQRPARDTTQACWAEAPVCTTLAEGGP
eukprot:8663625-Lingulodinium_polyedra.AAC.1